MDQAVGEEHLVLDLSRPQMEVMNARTRIIANIAGQGGGKTVTLSLIAGYMILKFPELKGFIGANTHMQLSQSTMSRLLAIFKDVYNMTEYDKVNNPRGHFIMHKKPPAHWKSSKHKFPSYNGIMSFWNGAVVFLGSLDNYEAHEGKEFGWAHLDETKDTEAKAVRTVILGRLRQKGLFVNENGDMYYNDKISNELAERNGWKSWNPLYIHTSPAEGNVDWLIVLLGIAPYEKEIRQTITNKITQPDGTVIHDYYYRVVDRATTVIYSSYHNHKNLPPSFIDDQIASKSASEILKFIYGYPFGNAGGQFFPGFDRLKHLAKLKHDSNLPLHLTWDFNAAPYVTLLLAHIDYVWRWYDEVERKKYVDKETAFKYCSDTKRVQRMEVLRFRIFKEYTVLDSTTESTCHHFLRDFGSYKPDILCYGDASGRARIVGMGTLTQYKIIETAIGKDLYLANGWLRTKKINIERLTRRDLMNRIWEGKIPQVELYIDDEDCPNLVADCEYLLKGKDGGKHKEKEKDANGIEFEKYGHPSDAMEYMVCELCQDYMKQ